jgi:hypothetical protein
VLIYFQEVIDTKVNVRIGNLLIIYILDYASITFFPLVRSAEIVGATEKGERDNKAIFQ